MNLLTLDSVNAHYGAIQALQDISFAIQEGEIAVLVGSNGAGKTTLLKTICGMNVPSKGSIHFDGHDTTSAQAHQMVAKGMNHVPEGRGIFPRLTVKENLTLGCYLNSDKHQNEKRTTEALDLFPRLLFLN